MDLRSPDRKYIDEMEEHLTGINKLSYKENQHTFDTGFLYTIGMILLTVEDTLCEIKTILLIGIGLYIYHFLSTIF